MYVSQPGDDFQLKRTHVAVKMVLIRGVMEGRSFLLIARGTLESCAVRTAATTTTTMTRKTTKITIPFILT
jgi:hypothetical protein